MTVNVPPLMVPPLPITEVTTTLEMLIVKLGPLTPASMQQPVEGGKDIWPVVSVKPVKNTIVPADAAMGTASAKITNSITRLMLIPPVGRFGPHLNEAQMVRNSFRLRVGPQPFSPQNTDTFAADELPK